VLHHVEAVEDDLGGGQRNGFKGELDAGLPLVHRNCLDAGELLRRVGSVKSRQTRFFAAPCDEPDGSAVNVVDDCQITMAFKERLPIDADAGDGGRLLAG
jgi:hypothetical protein